MRPCGADTLAMRASPDVVELDVENLGPPLTLQFRPNLADGFDDDRAGTGRRLPMGVTPPP